MQGLQEGRFGLPKPLRRQPVELHSKRIANPQAGGIDRYPTPAALLKPANMQPLSEVGFAYWRSIIL